MESCCNQMIAIMENGPFLTKEQRAAHTGPLKLAADSIRANFMPLAHAVVTPFLGTTEAVKADSTKYLADDFAMKLPAQLRNFLPGDQQARLVSHWYCV
jgi:hypothetical protein